MDLWKSIRIWARNLMVPVLVVAKPGWQRGESGDGVNAAILVTLL